jgi:hypothetical protein
MLPANHSSHSHAAVKFMLDRKGIEGRDPLGNRLFSRWYLIGAKKKIAFPLPL